MSYKTNYDPPGVNFLDRETGREMRIVARRYALALRVLARNDAGKWEYIRYGTAAEIALIDAAERVNGCPKTVVRILNFGV